MKFVQTGTFRENYLEEIVDFKPLENIENMFLEKLDYFIGFVSKEKPEIITKYVNNLVKKYQGLVEDNLFEKPSEKIKKILVKYIYLNQYPDLIKVSLNYFIHLLQAKEKDVLDMPEVKISRKALIQAWIYHSYYFLQALTETIDREEAVKLFKHYITNYYLEHPPTSRGEFVSLEKRLEDRTSGDTTSSEWVLVHTMLEDGKYAFKNKNCPTLADTMVDLTDVELKYLVACYGDYQKFRGTTNENIILTMEHTIIQGDSYCSRVLHDTRVDYDLRHPPKEFWDNFEPGNEEEAMKYYKKKK